MKKYFCLLLLLCTFPVFIIPVSQALPRYRHIATTPEDIVSMSAKYISPTQVQITLSNNSRTSIRLFTAGRQIRSIAPHSLILHKGRKTHLRFPPEISIPAGKSTTFRLHIPKGTVAPGATIVYNSISMLTANNGLNEGDFSLRATIAP
ncbi:MAG: hypothetical protein Q4F38_01680 [Akkermansia sp.]|nr:hypothetical protein [Akkermansia sp.]